MSAALIKYLNGICQIKKIHKILLFMKRDSDRLMNNPEYDVLQFYKLQGRKAVELFTKLMFVSLVAYVTPPTLVFVRDMIIKKNMSERTVMYPTEYSVDPANYYYLIMFHGYLATVITVFLVSALDTMYILFIQHACALFAVTGYRLKTAHILNLAVAKDEINFEFYKNKEFSAREQGEIHRRVVFCVTEHKRALEYTELIQSMFSLALFLVMALNIICLSIIGVQIILKLDNIGDVLSLGMWQVGQIIHLFFLCFPGQRLIDFSEQVYFDAMECMWHMCFKKSKVVYQFLVMNSLKASKLTALKVTSLSLETFVSVSQTAVSYFTVLLSAR